MARPKSLMRVLMLRNFMTIRKRCASVALSVKGIVTTMFEYIHDDWCECWESGVTSPDYSKCDCHLESIKRLQEIIERGKKANYEQERRIEELELKLSSAL